MNSLARWVRPGLTTWTGFGEVTSLQAEIDRLFGAPLAGLARSSQLVNAWAPAFDVYEDQDNVYVRAELPGMRKEDIDLSLHNGVLSVSGERKQDDKYKQAEIYRAERFIGRFQRTVELPTPVATDRVKAQYKDGILNVTLPKAEEAKPKHIDVNAS